MAMYVTCPNCGSNLDPGEKCDCQSIDKELLEQVYHFADGEPSIYEIEAAYHPAKRKLDDLIKRFGDDNGQRLQPRYLAQLICEQMRSERAAAMFGIMSELQKEKQPAPKFHNALTAIPNC